MPPLLTAAGPISSWWARTPCPTWLWSAAGRRKSPRHSSATPKRCGWASWSLRWKPPGPGRFSHRRRGQRPGPRHSGVASGDRRVIEDVIQTDAALDAGSSGGALADTHGRIVGINTAVAGAGLGLAVPINTTTRRIISALLKDGRVRRAYLGVVSTPSGSMPAQ